MRLRKPTTDKNVYFSIGSQNVPATPQKSLSRTRSNQSNLKKLHEKRRSSKINREKRLESLNEKRIATFNWKTYKNLHWTDEDWTTRTNRNHTKRANGHFLIFLSHQPHVLLTVTIFETCVPVFDKTDEKKRFSFSTPAYWGSSVDESHQAEKATDRLS